MIVGKRFGEVSEESTALRPNGIQKTCSQTELQLKGPCTSRVATIIFLFLQPPVLLFVIFTPQIRAKPHFKSKGHNRLNPKYQLQKKLSNLEKK